MSKVDSIRTSFPPQQGRMESTGWAAPGFRSPQRFTPGKTAMQDNISNRSNPLNVFLNSVVGNFGSPGAALRVFLIISLTLIAAARADTPVSVAPAAYHSPRQLQAAIENGLVTLDARSVPVADLLLELARQNNIEIVADGPIDGRITIELNQVPLPEAFRRILRNRDYALRYTSIETGEDSSTSNRRTTLWVFSENRANETQNGQSTANDELKSNSIKEIARSNLRLVRDFAKLEQNEALLQLNLALTDEDPSVRKEAVAVLAGLGGEDVISALASALWDSVPLVREEAVHALGEIGGETAVQFLRQAIMDQDNSVRDAAVQALFDIGGDEATRLLGAALQDPDTSVREEAIQALGEIGGYDSISFLQQALTDDDVGVRMAVVETVSDIGGEESTQLLRFALKDESAAVREAAIYELGDTGNDDAIPMIISALNDQDPLVRESARKALENLSTVGTR